MSLTIVLSGPTASEQQARNALVAAGFDVHANGHDYGLEPLSDQQAESFVCVTGDDIDQAAATVKPVGWVLRLHHETPESESGTPSPFEIIGERIGYYDAELADLKSRIALLEGNLPPIGGGAVESPPAFIQASTYGAEITRRSIGGVLQRGGNIGTPAGGLVADTDMNLSAPASGMSVNISPGEAYVPGSSSATQGAYYCRVSSISNLAIAAADPTNPRIDRVSAIVTDAAYSGSTNTFAVAVETGTPTAGATLANLSGAAAAPASSLTLGYVLVPATATNIIAADISNTAPLVASSLTTMTGTDATRPTAAQAPLREYIASDTNAAYQSNGTSWLQSTLYLSGTEAAKPLATAAKGYFYYATDSNALYWSDGTTWRVVYGSRGASNITTSQSTSSTTYTTLSTPDQVQNVVLPANGLIGVWFQATWQSSLASNNGRAAIFIGSNQLVIGNNNGSAVTQAAATPGVATTSALLTTFWGGLLSPSAWSGGYVGDVTTGQVVGTLAGTGGFEVDINGSLMQILEAPAGSALAGGPCWIFAAAGTYTVSIQFKSTSGSVTAANRKLWVQAIPFS